MESTRPHHFGKLSAMQFGIRLVDFHVGNVRTYQADRGGEVAAHTVGLAVDALLTLLKELNLGEEIERYFRHLPTTSELTPRRYITEMRPTPNCLGVVP
jgi:hypothetical protein